MSTGLNSYLVYKHTNKLDGKVYIGVTSLGLAKRAGAGGKMYKSSPRFFAAIKHYGWDNFEHQVVAEGLSIGQAAALEKSLIAECGSMDPTKGYNLHEGGFPSAEQRKAYESADRVSRIKETLHKQRSDPDYRKVMRDRMLEVWSRPEHRAKLAKIHKETNTPGGSPRIALLVQPGRLFFHSKRDASKYFGVCAAVFTNCQPRLKKIGDSADVRIHDQIYHIEVVKQRLKESELLEAVQPELF